MRRAAHLLPAALAVAGALALPSAALAQEWPIGASAEILSGVEGGGRGFAKGVRRARTLFRFGGEMAFADVPGPRIGAGLRIELEPHASFGADLRYIHVFSDRFALHIGGIAVIAPENLFGASAGAEYRLPLGKRIALTAGPTVQTYFVGGDLPEGTVIWQALFQVGVHVSLF